jgi:SAM-dependent methyltransferase
MEALGYEIERVECSIYDLDPTDVGQFDFVYVGSLLLHLRDPVRALERIRAVCHGEMLLVENVDAFMTTLHPRRAVATFDGLGRPWWWRLNLAAVERVACSAGFELIDKPKRLRFPRGHGRPIPPLRFSTLRDPALRRELKETLVGDSHAILRARPRPGI